MAARFEAMEANLHATLAIFSRAQAAGEVRAYPGVAVSCSALDFSMFNSAALTAPVESEAELDVRIKIAAAYYALKQLPWSFWVGKGWLGKQPRRRLEDIFLRNGLHLVVQLPGMAAERLLPPVRPLPAPNCQRVSDERTRAAFTHIMASTFGIPFRMCHEIYESEKTWSGGDFTGYVAYADEEPVATAATLIAAGVAGVYALATLAAHRRKGYGEAVMRYALETARREAGIEATVLESSAPGLRLYERMGYRAVTQYAVFAYS